jgi:hypothetical protein
VRHQHAGRCIHHGANGFGLGECLAATFVEILGAGGFLVGTGLGFGGGLGLGVFLGLRGSGLGGQLGVGGLLFGGGGRGNDSRRFDRLGRFLCGRCGGCSSGLLLGSDACGFLLCLFGALGLFGLLAFAGFGFFAQTALLDQLFFLAADQLGLAARVFLAASQFGLVDVGCGGRSGRSLGSLLCVLGRGRVAFIALDEGALLAHLDLNGAGAAGGVGLLDLAGRFLGQRDFLALGLGGAMAGFEKAEQALLVSLSECIGECRFGHACALELVKQGFGSLLELVRELGDSGTGHIGFVPP